MLNKNFFLGVLTTLLVMGILTTGGWFAIKAQTGAMTGGRPGGFEQRANRELPQGDAEPRQGGSESSSSGEFPHGERGGGHGSFSLLRGLGGILGSLLTIGVIVAAVVGGSMLFKRRQPTPTPAGRPEEPVAETLAAESLESVEPAESPAEPPAESLVEENDTPAGENPDPKTTNAD